MRRILIVLAIAIAAVVLIPIATAHPLGNFTVNRHVGVEVSGRRSLRSLRAGPGRDPDRSAGRRGPLGRIRGAGGRWARPPRRRRAARSRSRREARDGVTGCGRARDAPVRGGVRRGPRGSGRRDPRPQPAGSDRVARDRRVGSRRCGDYRIVGTAGLRERSSPRVPRRSAAIPARRPDRDGDCRARRRRGFATSNRPRAGARAPRRRLRGADRPRRAHCRCRSRLAGDRAVLGRRACTHPGPRKGPGRRVPRSGRRGVPAMRSCSGRR